MSVCGGQACGTGSVTNGTSSIQTDSLSIGGLDVLPLSASAVDGHPVVADTTSGELTTAATTATRWYVDGTLGNNLNDGLSRTSAFQSLQTGINAASSGDTIFVEPGSFTQDLTIASKLLIIDGPGVNLTGSLAFTGSGASLSRVHLNQIGLSASDQTTAIQVFSGVTGVFIKLARLLTQHPTNCASVFTEATAAVSIECDAIDFSDMCVHGTANEGTVNIQAGLVSGGRSTRSVFGGAAGSQTTVNATEVDVAGDLVFGPGTVSVNGGKIACSGQLSNISSAGTATMMAANYTGSLSEPGSGAITGVYSDGTNVFVRGDLEVPSTTPSSSTTTGAAVVAGGVGIAGDLNVGGDAGVAGLTFDSGTNVLGHYATATETLTYSGPLSDVDAGVTLTRIGNLVTMTIATVSGLGNSTAALITSTAISAAFRPAGAVHATALVNPGSAPEIRSTVQVSSTGVMTFFNGAAIDVTNTFAATGGGIVIQPFSVSWHV